MLVSLTTVKQRCSTGRNEMWVGNKLDHKAINPPQFLLVAYGDVDWGMELKLRRGSNPKCKLYEYYRHGMLKCSLLKQREHVFIGYRWNDAWLDLKRQFIKVCGWWDIACEMARILPYVDVQSALLRYWKMHCIPCTLIRRPLVVSWGMHRCYIVSFFKRMF